MKRRELITLLVCAVAVWPLKGLLIALALASPAFAQTPRDDGASIAAEAKDAATQLQAYLDGSRPDFSKPPASDLLGQVFNLKQLEALPPAQGDDLPWLLDWATTANGGYKSILFFGIAPPVTLRTDEAALQRNATDYEDQEAAAINFLLRIFAREIQAAFAFMDQLPPAQRTPVRIEGLNKMRVSLAETLVNDLEFAGGMKPANAGQRRHPRHRRGLGDRHFAGGPADHSRHARQSPGGGQGRGDAQQSFCLRSAADESEVGWSLGQSTTARDDCWR